MLKRIKVLRSYAAVARWEAETDDGIAGYIPRQSDIPSPYSYSPHHIVESRKGVNCIRVETAHRRFEIFEVPENMISKTIDGL